MPISNIASIQEEIRNLIARIVEVEPTRIAEETHLVEELGADSMMALEIMASLEKKYNITIPEEDLPKMTNLKQIMGLVTELLKI